MLSQDEIDSLLSNLAVGLDKPADGSNPHAMDELGEQRAYKLYNFRRPDKFSKDHLRALQTIHESFARQFSLVLTTYLRISTEIDVVSVDQLTYDEFVRSMPSPMTVCILEMPPLEGQLLLGLGYEVTSSVINRMLGGIGISESKARELTDIEQSLIRRVVDRSLACLEEAWGTVLGVNISNVGMQESYALIQVASPSEIVALITFEINLGNRDSGLMSLCIPYPVLETVIGQLSAQHIFNRQQHTMSGDMQETILFKLRNAKVPLQVFLGGTTVAVNDLLKLDIGDVIRLDRNVTDDLLVCVNTLPKFYARPGTLNDNMAVSINDDIFDEDPIEGFGFYDRR
jgi:flagellar motor switch protein FliM